MRVQHLFLALGILALAALATPRLTLAQTPERIASLQIAVWPEFDDPRVLVQYDGELAVKDGFPRDVSFYVPANAALTATAYADDQQNLLNTDPATVVDAGNGLQRVTFNLPKPHFHLEYYADSIKGAPDKSLEFVYNALLPADQLSIEVQQPLTAERFSTVPAAALVSDGMHNFKYHIFNYPGVAAGQAIKLQINYSKSDPKPSVENVKPPESAAGSTAAQSDLASAAAPTQLTVLVAGGVTLALALLALWMWLGRRQTRFAFAKPGGSAPSAKTNQSDRSGFCGQCGNALHANDNFCPRCGAKRK